MCAKTKPVSDPDDVLLTKSSLDVLGVVKSSVFSGL